MKKKKSDNRLARRLFTVGVADTLLAAIVLVVFVMLSACSAPVVRTIEVHDTLHTAHVDTVRQVIREQTTVTLRDSVSHTEYMRGDTLVIHDTKIVERFRDTQVSDSLVRTIADSISSSFSRLSHTEVPAPKVRKLSRWEKMLLNLGKASLCLLLLALLAAIWRLNRKYNVIAKLLSLLRK